MKLQKYVTVLIFFEVTSFCYVDLYGFKVGEKVLSLTDLLSSPIMILYICLNFSSLYSDRSFLGHFRNWFFVFLGLQRFEQGSVLAHFCAIKIVSILINLLKNPDVFNNYKSCQQRSVQYQWKLKQQGPYTWATTNGKLV